MTVNIDLANRNSDQIITSIGEIEKSSFNDKLQFLKTKDKGDKEFIDEITMLQSLQKLVSKSNCLIINRIKIK